MVCMFESRRESEPYLLIYTFLNVSADLCPNLNNYSLENFNNNIIISVGKHIILQLR
jgi:hypothetical protein